MGIDMARVDSDVCGLTLRNGDTLVMSPEWDGEEFKLEEQPYVLRKQLLTQDEVDVLFGKHCKDERVQKAIDAQIGSLASITSSPIPDEVLLKMANDLLHEKKP